MPHYKTGTVSSLISERPGLQRIEVDGSKAYVLTQLIGPVAVGDEVVVNVTATDLDLGTGGWDVVHWNLSRREWHETGPGHVMKLRYTSLQADTGVSEEHGGESVDLRDLPVVACFLHSQLAPVALGFAESAPGRKLGYVMTDSAALPFALSDLVASLVQRRLLHTTVSAGQAFGAELEAVNVLSGLAVALKAGCDAAVVAPGPGVVGTGSRYGYSAIEVASVVDLASGAKARPVVAVRWSDADQRERHRGLSHHVSTVLELAHGSACIASATGYDLDAVTGPHQHTVVEVPDIAAGLADLGVTTMMRTPSEDRGFFEMAAAAGVVAAGMLDS